MPVGIQIQVGDPETTSQRQLKLVMADSDCTLSSKLANSSQLTTTSSMRMKKKTSLTLMSRTAITTRKVSPPINPTLTSALKEEDPKEALNEFRVVVETESEAGEKGDWYSPMHNLIQGF
jgi:hypothetical protein